MKYILLFTLYFLSHSTINSQDYFNKIIRFIIASPTTSGLFINPFDEAEFFIPLIYVGSESAIIRVNANLENQEYYYDFFDFSYMPLAHLNGKIILYGKDRTQNNDLRTMRLDESFEVDWVKQYSSLGEWNFPTFSLGLDSFIYVSYIDDFDNGDHREIGIKKIDTLGNEVWSRNYNRDVELSYAWEIESTKDKHVLISAGVHYYEKNGRYSQITKIDTSGEIIWTYEGTEAFDNGAVPVWIAELSDGNIVMSYYITGLQAPDTRLQWIDKDGKYLKRQLIDVPDKDEMYHYQLEAGQGAYFYAYGTYTYGDDNTSHGLITKYDNDGNIIWEHLYQHELFAQGGDRTSIKDIIEEENGDIVVLGDLSHPGDKNEIWLFKLNEHGCFGTEDCDEELVLSGIDEMHIDPSPQIYPNPVDGILNIYSEDSRIVGSKLRIANLSGQELGQYDIPSYNSQIDISNIPKSIYIYTITDKSGEVLKIGKFVKE